MAKFWPFAHKLQKSVIYGNLLVNYGDKSFVEEAQDVEVAFSVTQ